VVVVFESSLPPSIGKFSLTATVQTAAKPAVGLKAAVAMRDDAINSETHPATTVDPWELHLLLVELKDWELSGDHHLHKSQQFQSCQQALKWHSLAQALSECHGQHCLFYLGSVGCGRIGTDIISPIHGHLTRADLDLAIKLNALEKTVKCHPQLL
jgi:pterin-4a-carbinolamine dehydratase